MCLPQYYVLIDNKLTFVSWLSLTSIFAKIIFLVNFLRITILTTVQYNFDEKRRI